MNKKIFEEEEYLMHTDSQEFASNVEELESLTEIIDSKIPEIRVVPVDEPISVLNYVKEYKIDEEEYAGRQNDFLIDTGIYGSDKLFMRNYAMPTLENRARISGTALGKVSASEFSNILNMCLKTNPEKSQIIKIGPTISAFLSQNYKPISAKEIFRCALNEMNEKGAKFCKGLISLDYFVAEWEMNEKVVEPYRAKTSNFNWNVKPILRVVTSNTGASGANIFPMFRKRNVEFIVGPALRLEHRGEEATIEKFEENIRKIYGLFQKTYKNLDELKAIIINYPLDVFKKVTAEVGIPKKYVLPALQDFEDLICGVTNISAYDLYMGITEVLFHAQNDKIGEGRLLDLQEQVSRVLGLDISKYDYLG